MKLGIIGYVPPPSFGYPQVFLRNLQANPPKEELILYSDHDWPGTIRLKGSPEQARTTAPKNKFGVNNFIFYTGLRIALAHGLTHICYLEADCRVGRPGWDEVMWQEFFSATRPCAIGGTMVCYNPCNSGGLEGARRWNEAVARNTRRNFPVATYGWKGASESGGTSVFVNGALGIYSVAWLQELFPASELNGSAMLADGSFAWDFEIGFRLWAKLGPKAYEVVEHMDCIYSGYGEELTTEAERLGMLKSGQVVAVHQVKSNA